MTEKVHIEDLPITDRFLSQKRLVQERGELALIEDGMTINHLGYFSLLGGKGYRGGHYHLKKAEHFYVISGKLKVDLFDLDTDTHSQIFLHQGQKAIIYPRCAHRFAAEKSAQVIEYYEGIYEKDDDFPYDFDA